MNPYYLTKNKKLAAALVSLGHECEFIPDTDGKGYFQFENDAVLQAKIEKYHNGTLGDGFYSRMEVAVKKINDLVRGRV